MTARPVLVIGETGQVARALGRHGAVAGHPIVCLGRARIDATDGDRLAAEVQALAPLVIINAAAYTAVDKAETDQAAAESLNVTLPARLAHLADSVSAPFVHLSTDYVFDGQGQRPYREDDPIAPLGVYGRTKADGEAAVRAGTTRHLILRTSWVWAEDGQNFVRTMLRLGREREEVRVVADQRGSPTYAGALADAILALVGRSIAGAAMPWGTYHLTNAGETTWHGFAAAIFAEAKAAGLKTPRLTPITTAEYPTPARRPGYSVLDCAKARRMLGVHLPDWEQSLASAFPRVLANLP